MDADGLLDGGRAVDGEGARTSGSASVDVSVTDRDAAGTGSARHHAFLQQAVAHHAELRAFFNPRILRREKFTAWDDVPPFSYVEESARAVALRVAPALLGLLLAATALTVWAASTLRRTAI